MTVSLPIIVKPLRGNFRNAGTFIVHKRKGNTNYNFFFARRASIVIVFTVEYRMVARRALTIVLLAGIVSPRIEPLQKSNNYRKNRNEYDY